MSSVESAVLSSDPVSQSSVRDGTKIEVAAPVDSDLKPVEAAAAAAAAGSGCNETRAAEPAEARVRDYAIATST